MTDLAQLEAENAQMMNALAMVAENRRLRTALAAAGLPPPVAPRKYLADLLLIVATSHGLTSADLSGVSGVQHIARARQNFMWAARQVKANGKPLWSNAEIGRVLFRDPSTVSTGAAAHERRMAAELAGGPDLECAALSPLSLGAAAPMPRRTGVALKSREST